MPGKKNARFVFRLVEFNYKTKKINTHTEALQIIHSKPKQEMKTKEMVNEIKPPCQKMMTGV